MDIKEAIQKRHTVRKFLDKPIEADKLTQINERIDTLNKKHNLSLKLITNNSHGLATGWKLIAKNATNFIILAGQKTPTSREKIGYASSDLMLYAQTLGLNTWWIGGMYSKKIKALTPDAHIVGILVIGYGATQGHPHESKTAQDVSTYAGTPPQWFKDGVQAALLAPTAINRQGFTIKGEGDKVNITYKKAAFDMEDLGIVKHHFETAANPLNFTFE